MHKTSRLLSGAALAALLLGPVSFAAADHDDLPTAKTLEATAITDDSATLTGEVKNKEGQTSFRFEYGTTTSYGQSTAAATLPPSNATRAVTAPIDGLTPETVYHFRLRATNDEGTSKGADRSFTTTASPATPSVSGTEVPAPLSTASPDPVLGRSVVVAPLQGTITVRRPGSQAYVTLAAGDSVPVGTLVDTRRGTVNLTSSLGAGESQSGTFRGALFQVRQAGGSRGLTDLVMRGANFASCSRATSRIVRAASKPRARKRPTRRLWGSDKGGRFRTHGRDSVATVRGTSWVTTDTCLGTRTRVIEGAVEVRDRRRAKTVLVRAGHSYLARHKRSK